jgi:hypothetical protein
MTKSVIKALGEFPPILDIEYFLSSDFFFDDFE